MSSDGVLDILRNLPCQHDAALGWLKRHDINNHYPWYAKIAAALEPASILEIGAFIGYGLVSFALGSKKLKRIEWIDIEEVQGTNKMAETNLVSVFPKLEYQYWPSMKVATPSLPVDLIHVDGDHYYDGCRQEIEYAVKHQPKVIVGHDYYLIQQVANAVRDFSAETGLRHWTLPEFTHGLWVIPLQDKQQVIEKLSKAGVGPVNEY